MSKEQQYEQQVHEKSGLNIDYGKLAQRTTRMLRCRMSLILICLIVAGCGAKTASTARKDTPFPRSATLGTEEGLSRTTLRRGMPGEPRTLDPELADDEFSFQVVRDLYEGLTAEDPAGHIVPGVAQSWTVDESGTVYTFHLRANAKWSDGTQVSASQFVNGLRRAVDPRTASGSAALLDEITGAAAIIAGRLSPRHLGVSAVGQNSLQIRLVRPTPYFVQILSQPIAAPLRFNANLPNYAPNPAVTDGPYILENRAYGAHIDLRRNPYYWDSAHVAIPKIRYLISDGESTELREYLAGEIDMTYAIPMPDLPRLLSEDHADVQMEPILATFYLALNLFEPRIRGNAYLRQALSMSIDRRLIAQKVMLGVRPAFSYVPPGVENYAPPEYQWSKWSRSKRIQEAQRLLGLAGYSESHPLHLRVYFNNDETIRRVMIAIAANWKQNLGISVEMISDEFRVFLVRRKDHDRWDIARYGWTADYDDAASFLEVFTSGSTENDSGYTSVSYNSFLHAARLEPNILKRRDLLERAEGTLLNDYAIIPIYFYKARRLVKPYVGGATITPLNRTYSRYLYWKSQN